MLLPGLRAQESRAEEVQAQREEKARNLQPDDLSSLERNLMRLREGRWIERISEGFGGVRLKVGGMAPGAGFGFGPEYRWQKDPQGNLFVRAAALTSTRRYQKYEFQTGMPHLAGDRLFTDFYAVRHDYSSLGYYGPGPDSNKSGRSNYRLEDVAVDATFGVRRIRHLSIGASAGYVINNVGPGTDERFISAEQIYSPGQAPGIDQQANFLRIGSFVQYDYRDQPDAHKGGNYFAQYSNYSDRTLGLYDFRRLDVELQQFIPITNERRVFALRAKSAMTFQDAGQTMPFYFHPSLGGSDDLRGYRPYRFRDNNLVVFNAEYRWQVFSGLDMALFADAGKVTHRISQLNLRDLESDAGFGFRFNTRNKTVMRLDFGFSHEGFQVSVKFNNIFRQGPLHSSSSQREEF